MALSDRLEHPIQVNKPPHTMTAFGRQTERRHFGRRKVATAAQIELPLRPLLACHVIDISPAGAMLEVGPKEWLPSRFRLITQNARYECTVKHRDGAIVGVAFQYM